MERFQTFLREQLGLHPAMQPRDVAKMCYQACCGAEHLLSDVEGVRRYFDSEYAETPADAALPLYEQISEGICRVNLGAWKAAGLDGAWLFRMFADTKAAGGTAESMVAYLDAAESVLSLGEAWTEFRRGYEAEGMPPVRHTEQYRVAEHPAYRIVDTKYLRILPVLLHIKELQGGVIALDGRAGAGKSTVSALLRYVLDGGIAYMDDFFLPPAMRSEERLAEPGGNVHYERFTREVVCRLREKADFAYNIFDCSRMELNGQRTVKAAPWRIVEGSYSQHPVFGAYADVRVFVDVSPEEQLRRIELRNGREMMERFRARWIPMEEAYFKAFAIKEQANIVI